MVDIRERGSILYLGVAKEISNLPQQDDSQRSWKTPKQTCRSIDTTYQFTKIFANLPLSMQDLRNRPSKKS